MKFYFRNTINMNYVEHICFWKDFYEYYQEIKWNVKFPSHTTTNFMHLNKNFHINGRLLQ